MPLIDNVRKNPALKRFIHRLLLPPGQARPRTWVRWLVNPFVHQCGRGAIIRRSVRLDVVPFQPFTLGAGSTIEDFAVVNNGVGPVSIGNVSRVGIGSVVIGPVSIGNQVIIAQHVVISGLNHTYTAIDRPIRQQPVEKKPVRIDDECWLGANAVITAGVHIGKHSVVAAGSVVTKDVPAYSVVAGNPARVIRQYDRTSGMWEKAAPPAPAPPQMPAPAFPRN